MEQYTWMILYSLCSLYWIMDVIKDAEEVGLNHGWYYIVYVVIYSIMDVIKDDSRIKP